MVKAPPTQHPLILRKPSRLLHLRLVCAGLIDRADRFSIFLNSNTLACGRLIRRAFALHELPSLIETVFSGEDEGNTLQHLYRDDAQIFADVIDEVRFSCHGRIC